MTQIESQKENTNLLQNEEKPIIKVTPVTKFFFLKPILGILLCMLMIVGGLIGFTQIVKEGDPDIEQARASITTIWEGADPETIENQITDELEKELKSMKGLKNISSASFESQSRINIEFVAEADVLESIALTRAEVDEAKPELPTEAEEPKVTQVSVQDTPILTIGLFGDLDPAVMSRAAEDIQEILEKVPNVREVDLAGKREEVIHIQLNLTRMRILGIAPTQVADAIQNGNQDTPWDRIEDDGIGSQLRFYGRFRTLEDLRNLPVARLGDTERRVVRLNEVAQVRRDLEKEENRANLSVEGGEFKPAVVVDIVKVPGADTIQIIDDCLKTIEETTKNPGIWPFGMKYKVINTDKDEIQADLANVFNNVWQGVLGVFIVLLIALTWREAIIAGLSIPLTFLGALAIIYLLGFSLNTMVQIGMILSLGLLVDVFILMMEGMHDGIFVEGLSWEQAALKTVKTYALPAFTGQLTTILALAPLAAISGTMGKFVRLIPISAVTCLLLSYGISLLVDIPLSRLLLGKIEGKGKKTWMDKITEVASDNFTNWTLAFTIPNKTISRFWILVALGLFVFSTILVGTVPSTLFPDGDERKMSVNIELSPNTTLESSQIVADDIGDILRSKDYLESVVQLVGQRSNFVTESGIKPNDGDYLVGFTAVFKPLNQREKYSFEYDQELRNDLNQAIRKYPGSSLTLNIPTSGEGGDPIELEITGSDMAELRRISKEVQQVVREIPGSLDVRDDLGTLQRDIKLRPRREAIDFYDLTPGDIASQGRYIMTDSDIGDFPLGGGEEDLEMRLSTQWPSRNGAIGGPTTKEELIQTRFITPSGAVISGGEILEFESGEAPISITHQDGERTVTVLSKTQGRTVGQIWQDLEPKLQSMAQTWPRGYSYKLAGEAETQGETFASAGQMAIVAIFLVFAVLVLQFSSFTQPLIIMMSIPLALIGTFTGFFLFQIPISFPAVIGIISLTGIVVNDAIVMVETMNNFREKGMDIRHAAANGVAARLRPILTTSITTIVGVIPLALSDPTWFPLASAIGFGLVASTIIALFIIPCLYLQLTSSVNN